MNAFYRIHAEHEPARQLVVRLCEYHLRQAEDCLMVDERNVPIVDSTCFCNVCHFCDN